jgi:MFS family permease
MSTAGDATGRQRLVRWWGERPRNLALISRVLRSRSRTPALLSRPGHDLIEPPTDTLGDAPGGPLEHKVTVGRLFRPDLRSTTIGLLLLMAMVAFEAMGVGAVMPAVIAELGALSGYAWPFVVFAAAGVGGTVLGGRWCDRAGTRAVLLLGPTLFGLGLLASASALAMPVLLLGRGLQGVSAGAVTVAIFVVIAQRYPRHARPAMFGMLSAAWTCAALLGPLVCGLVATWWSWRWVFSGLIPLTAVTLVLVASLPHRARPTDQPGEPGIERARRGLVVAALGAALGMSVLSVASSQSNTFGAVAAGVALIVIAVSARWLLPAGALRARRGIAAVVATRGLCASVFTPANSYLPLMLTGTHHWPLALAGAPMVIATLGWSSAAWWQGRHPDLARTRLLRRGLGLLTIGAGGLILVAPSWGVSWLALPVWGLAGAGMGLCFPSLALLLQHQSEPTEIGFHTSAAQIADQLGGATVTAAGGALLAATGTPSTALMPLCALLTVLGMLGVAITGRTMHATRPHDRVEE